MSVTKEETRTEFLFMAFDLSFVVWKDMKSDRPQRTHLKLSSIAVVQRLVSAKSTG